jgi:hypothetical protein
MATTTTTAVLWTQGHDAHTWNARVGDIYRLRVVPVIGPNPYNAIHYRAELCNSSLSELAREDDLPTVEIAKQRAIYLCWRHNFDIGDMLLTLV